MARGLKRSLISNPVKKTEPETVEGEQDDATNPSDATPPAFKRASSGAGSAWKAGALEHAQAGLEEARHRTAQDILAGDVVIEIEPGLISDPIGSDRRGDWMEQEGFKSLVQSIRENGQDMPVLVWPKDPDWQPDELEPKNLERVQFLLLAGRRRCEAARILGKPVRAVIASQEGRDGAHSTFNMLVLRFRENIEREDLSAFERLLSIGQMFEELISATKEKITAKDFAERIGVHESIVSRSRAVLKAKDQILNAFKNVYEMSFRELQNVLADLSESSTKPTKKASKPKKLKVSRKIGNRNLSVEAVGGKLSVKTTGVKLDKQQLEGLGDLVADYLEKHGSK